MAVAVDVVESLAAKFSTLLPHLDERAQRLYLGSEARSLGHGGIAAVARAAGVRRETVARGGGGAGGGGEPARGRVRRGGVAGSVADRGARRTWTPDCVRPCWR